MLNFKVGDLFVNVKECSDSVYEVLSIDENSVKFTDQFTGFRIDFRVKEQVEWLSNCVDYYDLPDNVTMYHFGDLE